VSLFLNFRDLLCNAKSFQDFRGRLIHCQWLVASAAVLSDGAAIRGCVRAVMAAKATRKIHVAEVVRICAPRDLQIRKDIAIVDLENRLTSLADVLRTRAVKVRVVLLIKAHNSGGLI
jgi:hypothetical protein